jgi:hypothetical protein
MATTAPYTLLAIFLSLRHYFLNLQRLARGLKMDELQHVRLKQSLCECRRSNVDERTCAAAVSSVPAGAVRGDTRLPSGGRRKQSRWACSNCRLGTPSAINLSRLRSDMRTVRAAAGWVNADDGHARPPICTRNPSRSCNVMTVRV